MLRQSFFPCVLSACIAFASSASAWRVPVDPNCPTYGNGLTWQQYLSGKYTRLPGKAPSLMSVQFRFAKDVGNPDIGGIPTNVCYTVRYVKPRERYYGEGFFSVPSTFPGDNPPIRRDLPGDPRAFEVNVYGTILLFRNSGEVIDRRGRVVGVMVCYLSNECGGY